MNVLEERIRLRQVFAALDDLISWSKAHVDLLSHLDDLDKQEFISLRLMGISTEKKADLKESIHTALTIFNDTKAYFGFLK